VNSQEEDKFVTKLRSLTLDLVDGSHHGAVLLIGIDENGPLTIIEGNHRMAAASLIAPSDVHDRFRFLCGFSPRMNECCWYQTDLGTLWRYARNLIPHLLDDQEVVLAQGPGGDLECQAHTNGANLAT
jgi:hypothetical protein